MKPMMKCGHAANGKSLKTARPVCLICPCETPGIMPDLTNRFSKCTSCDTIVKSDSNLPFFRHVPDEKLDQHYDGCAPFGWD